MSTQESLGRQNPWPGIVPLSCEAYPRVIPQSQDFHESPACVVWLHFGEPQSSSSLGVHFPNLQVCLRPSLSNSESQAASRKGCPEMCNGSDPGQVRCEDTCPREAPGQGANRDPGLPSMHLGTGHRAKCSMSVMSPNPYL